MLITQTTRRVKRQASGRGRKGRKKSFNSTWRFISFSHLFCRLTRKQIVLRIPMLPFLAHQSNFFILPSAFYHHHFHSPKSFRFFAHKKCGVGEEREAWINYTLLTFDLIIICAGLYWWYSLQNSDSIQRINNIFLGSFFHVNWLKYFLTHTIFSFFSIHSPCFERLASKYKINRFFAASFNTLFISWKATFFLIWNIQIQLWAFHCFSLLLLKRIFPFDDW